MDGFQKEINEIVRSCAGDEELRRVVLNINEMNCKQREEFLKKVNVYFLSQKSSLEAQAYKFFELLLNDGIRGIIVERLKGS